MFRPISPTVAIRHIRDSGSPIGPSHTNYKQQPTFGDTLTVHNPNNLNPTIHTPRALRPSPIAVCAENGSSITPTSGVKTSPLLSSPRHPSMDSPFTPFTPFKHFPESNNEFPNSKTFQFPNVSHQQIVKPIALPRIVSNALAGESSDSDINNGIQPKYCQCNTNCVIRNNTESKQDYDISEKIPELNGNSSMKDIMNQLSGCQNCCRPNENLTDFRAISPVSCYQPAFSVTGKRKNSLLGANPIRLSTSELIIPPAGHNWKIIRRKSESDNIQAILIETSSDQNELKNLTSKVSDSHTNSISDTNSRNVYSPRSELLDALNINAYKLQGGICDFENNKAYSMEPDILLSNFCNYSQEIGYVTLSSPHNSSVQRSGSVRSSPNINKPPLAESNSQTTNEPCSPVLISPSQPYSPKLESDCNSPRNLIPPTTSPSLLDVFAPLCTFRPRSSPSLLSSNKIYKSKTPTESMLSSPRLFSIQQIPRPQSLPKLFSAGEETNSQSSKYGMDSSNKPVSPIFQSVLPSVFQTIKLKEAFSVSSCTGKMEDVEVSTTTGPPPITLSLITQSRSTTASPDQIQTILAPTQLSIPNTEQKTYHTSDLMDLNEQSIHTEHLPKILQNECLNRPCGTTISDISNSSIVSTDNGLQSCDMQIEYDTEPLIFQFTDIHDDNMVKQKDERYASQNTIDVDIDEHSTFETEFQTVNEPENRLPINQINRKQMEVSATTENINISNTLYDRSSISSKSPSPRSLSPYLIEDLITNIRKSSGEISPIKLSPECDIPHVITKSGELTTTRAAKYQSPCLSIQCLSPANSPSVSPKNSLTVPNFSPRSLSPSSFHWPDSPVDNQKKQSEIPENNDTAFDNLLSFEGQTDLLHKRHRILSTIESEDEFSDHSNKSSSKSYPTVYTDDVFDTERGMTPQLSPRMGRKRTSFDIHQGSLSSSSSMSNLMEIPEIPAIHIDQYYDVSFADESSDNESDHTNVHSVVEQTMERESLMVPSSDNSRSSSPENFTEESRYSLPTELYMPLIDVSGETPLSFSWNGTRRSSFLQEGFSRVQTPVLGDEEKTFRSVSSSPFGDKLKYFQEQFKNQMFALKTAVTRLSLKTRRKSNEVWRSNNLDKHGKPRLKKKEDIPNIALNDKSEIAQIHVGKTTDRFTAERVDKITDALQWIKNELVIILWLFRNLIKIPMLMFTFIRRFDI